MKYYCDVIIVGKVKCMYFVFYCGWLMLFGEVVRNLLKVQWLVEELDMKRGV